MNTAYAILALLLTVPLAEAYPTPRDDFGEDNWGLERNPPPPDVPNVDVPEADLSKLLEITLSGLQAGDKVTTALGSGNLLLSLLDDRSLQLDLVSPSLVKRLTLPPVPEIDASTVTLLVTPATVSVDRVGDNPVPSHYAGELDKSALRDASMTVWAAKLHDLHTVAGDPAGRIAAPATVQKAAVLHDMVPLTDPVTDLILLDPDHNALFGSLEDHTLELPLTDSVSVSKADIQNALQTAALTDLTIDGVLSGLQESVKELGAVDVSSLAQTMVDSDLALRRVSLPTPDPKTILDLDKGELVLVDGGLGKITSLAGTKSLAFDGNLLTQLKDPESIKETAVHYVGRDRLDVDKQRATALFDAKVGNYGQILERSKALLQHGIDTEVLQDVKDCKARMATKMKAATQVVCTGPEVPAIGIHDARFMHYLAAVDKDAALQKVTGAAGGVKPAAIGTPTGLLGDLPAPSNVPSIAAFGFAPEVPNLSFADFSLPEAGLASLPEVEAWNTAPDLPTVSPDMDWPGMDASILHGVFEAWDMGFMPGLVSVVPLDAATSAFGAVADLTTGNGLMAMPASILQGLPIGTTSELTLRFVGEAGSIFSNQGIEGVRVQLTSGDPLGMTTSTSTHQSNLNGYVVVPVASLGTWSIVGQHDDYQDVNAGGQAPPPGGSAGQEVTMKSASGNAAKDFATSNSTWILLVVVAVVVLAASRGKIKDAYRRRFK